MGPEIALLPYLEMTSGLDDVTKGIIVRKMLRTAGVAALVLIGTGELLARLLHFSTGSLSIAGGVILVIIATTMVLGTGGGQEELAGKERDPIRLALFPPTVPYLLNPAGVVTLVTLSAEANSAVVFVMVLGVLAVVLALDAWLFRLANRLSDHMQQDRMLVIEKIFGFLLAALAVQLVLDGLESVGVIHLAGH